MLRSVLSAICHQQPDRSFIWLWDPPLLCARCTGLYLSIICGALAIFIFRVKARPLFLLFGLFFSIILLGLEKASGLFEGTSIIYNWVRFTTGFVIGSFLSFGIFRAIISEKEKT
jgi:uncharacterized membrane protein